MVISLEVEACTFRLHFDRGRNLPWSVGFIPGEAKGMKPTDQGKFRTRSLMTM
jgi:hypothetical protein